MRSFRLVARDSPLSRAQVEEVIESLRSHHPEASFERLWLRTYGDRDRQTSLKTLPASDFFTREVDEALLRGDADIAVHSAKDLPPELPAGVRLAGVTRCLDPRDSLVFRRGLTSLFPGARVATSSLRRDAALRALEPECRLVDLRGTIEERLRRLDQDCDAVVIAECALIRLQLTSWYRVELPGTSPPGQGRLALVIRDSDAGLIPFLLPILEHTAWALPTG